MYKHQLTSKAMVSFMTNNWFHNMRFTRSKVVISINIVYYFVIELTRSGIVYTRNGIKIINKIGIDSTSFTIGCYSI
jgi:hypothetical protein